MRIMTPIVGLFCAITISGCIEKETDVSIIYANATSRNIQVFTYPGDPFFLSSDTSWFILAPFEEITALTISDRGESSTFPNNIFPFFDGADSSVVVFSDTMHVTHFTVFFSRDQDTIREDVISYEDSRNIFNQAYFTIEKTGENSFKATYSFTEDDVGYAISINE